MKKKPNKQTTLYIYTRYIKKYLLTILDITILITSILLITNGQKFLGWTGITIVIIINLYSIYKTRDFLKNLWLYINYKVDQQIEKEKKLRK